MMKQTHTYMTLADKRSFKSWYVNKFSKISNLYQHLSNIFIISSDYCRISEFKLMIDCLPQRSTSIVTISIIIMIYMWLLCRDVYTSIPTLVLFEIFAPPSLHLINFNKLFDIFINL